MGISYRSAQSNILASGKISHKGRTYTAILTIDKLEEIDLKTLEHPPYSRDFSSCDYFLFKSLVENYSKAMNESDADVTL